MIFCPEAFRGIVQTQARLAGMPLYEPVTIPGMVVAQSPQEIIAKVDRIAPMIIQGLVKKQT